MINNNIYNLFKSASETRQWSGLCNNGVDCCFLNNIPANIKNSARQNFGINHQEEIVFFRDTSFWNSENQGLVITDTAIYCIPDNEDANSRFAFTWDIIKDVKYLDECLYFHGYDGDDDVCPINMMYFLKDSSKDYLVNDYGKKLATLFTRIASSVKHVDPFDENNGEVDKLVENGKIDDAISLVKSIISQDDGTYKSYWYLRLSEIVTSKNTTESDEESAKYCIEGLKYCEDGSSISIYLRNQHRILLGLPHMEETISIDEEEPVVSMLFSKLLRQESLWVSQNATDQTDYDGALTKEEASKDFEASNSFYCKNFIRQPYNERKVLLVVKEYTDLRQDGLCVMKRSDIPSDMCFPIGHPQEGQIYVGHPFTPAKYFPFEEYRLEFIEDKVREFTWLMQCMGATKISISARNDNEQSGDYSSNRNISGSSSYGVAKANGSYSGNSKGSFAEQISKAISLNQDFKPTKAPYIPDGLVWYQNEPSWQRLVHQRMEGSLRHATESIESRKSNMVNGSELKTIKAEFQSLVSLDGEWTSEDESKFEQNENATLTFEIDFAPIESLTNDLKQEKQIEHSILTTATEPIARKVVISAPLSSEQEYLNELRECFDDGEISPRERRLLDKLASKLGITPARAMELEASLSAPSFTDDEKEYLEEVKAVLEDGAISDKERRLLEKLRKMYDISESRAKELEEYASR